jgi:hypothetical protein
MYRFLRRSGLRKRFFSLQDKKMGTPFELGTYRVATQSLAFLIIYLAKILQDQNPVAGSPV